MRLFALTTRGLEAVGADELQALPGIELRQRAYRRVLADYAGPAHALLELRTIDDVFVHLDTWSDVAHTRDFLGRFTELSRRLDVETGRVYIASARAMPDAMSFSVTANFVGRRNYNAEEIKQAVAEGVSSVTGWPYEADDAAAALNLRVFIDHEQALVGLRLSQRPLHERDYRARHRPGALKPTVAAAMLQLGALQQGARLLDPFCGTATIVIEAALCGALAAGGDSDALAVDDARENLRAAGVDASIQQWDARKLPLAGGSVDLVVSNPPWNRQVTVDQSLAAFYRRSTAELRRVLVADGRMVLLVGEPSLVAAAGFRVERELEISLFGQTPRIVVYGPG